MPGIPAARRKPFISSTRAGISQKRNATHEIHAAPEPPRKKRRYVPGGPGGGGRYVEMDGTEIPVGGTGPGGYNYVGPRGRVGPQNAANGVQPMTYERPRRESRRERPATRPRYSSAAAAAAAVVQGDGFKPREERGWEEFHQDLDIDIKLPVFSANEVDGIVKITQKPRSTLTNGNSKALRDGTASSDGQPEENMHNSATETISDSGLTDKAAHLLNEDNIESLMALKRRPGRPPRRYDSMLKGIGTPDTPKVVPLPGPNPREKLTLPKPSFRKIDPFIAFEQKAVGQLNYVDRTMANVGYQESDIWIRPRNLIRLIEGNADEELDLIPATNSEVDGNVAIGATGVGMVEYDMDEQDQNWLEEYNKQRKEEQVEPIKPAIFEITMTKIEKEWHTLEKRIPKPNPKPPQTHRPRSSSAAAVNGEPAAAGEEQDTKCEICDDGDCENTNAIVFCDGCDLAVHQECYGVPFIPEGQWLCRKCQLIGRGTPTCIFCPNTDGAFKQTNSSRWSHLLCAIWIPEVSLGNATFMEPVMDVEKVPKQRWKLTCYICRQKMGACIQCGNKNCFVAFHVTCARRARLFLQMKSTHGGPNFDASVLKAFCDKHVPNDWRRDNDTDTATNDAMDFYRYTMRGRLWADSQQSAMNMAVIQAPEVSALREDEPHPKINLIIGGNKRKRPETNKAMWRLPSGAPIIPAVVYESVASSLQRLTVRKRRDFAADMCKYWTLKREVRRGAPLIKRLQLQMETFSSMEMTRRNFAGMGAAGRIRLQRRIDFAEARLDDLERLRTLARMTMERERLKLQDVEVLRDLVDTLYFPISPLLWPILEKAQALDGKGTFGAGLERTRERLQERFYTSVSTFSTDLGTVFSAEIGMLTVADTAEVQSKIIDDKLRKDLSAEQKDKRKLAKRIIKAIQPALEDAMHKESELCRRPFEKELRDLDSLLENSLSSRRDSMNGSIEELLSDEEAEDQKPTTNGHPVDLDVAPAIDITDQMMGDADAMEADQIETHVKEDPASADLSTNGHTNTSSKATDQVPPKSSHPPHQPTPPDSHATPPVASQPVSATSIPDDPARSAAIPPTPPLSSGGDLQTALSNGGIPWYMEPFDPVGTTVYEERWTGREVARGMSEELSDMDEDELDGLVDAETGDGEEGVMEVGDLEGVVNGNETKVERKKNGKMKKRWRGFR